jgi:hypothetical protein
VLLVKRNYDYEIRDEEIGGTCKSKGKEDKRVQSFGGKTYTKQGLQYVAAGVNRKQDINGP